LKNALNIYQYQLKGISFLPRQKLSEGKPTVYPQMPYEMISEERYLEELSRIQPLSLQNILTQAINPSIPEVPDKFCDSAGCIVQSEIIKEL
jgi:ribonucleoside-triphosphate reductase